jgi:hypothetical protein
MGCPDNPGGGGMWSDWLLAASTLLLRLVGTNTHSPDTTEASDGGTLGPGVRTLLLRRGGSRALCRSTCCNPSVSDRFLSLVGNNEPRRIASGLGGGEMDGRAVTASVNVNALCGGTDTEG